MTAASREVLGGAGFDRRYGSVIALAVATIALDTAIIVYAYAMRLTL
ncbi:MAG: hypothetical protein IOC90_01485 [Methylocystis sp.]|nr:hypothetical protein [Methylocystis sp.]MCA3584053.1 hypothetical protein [Methylocystis sp.]MCA3586697.1 hypothetical protein [Methylocystis sp.]MCA3591667.1 hypothetical protein [Methylocystis sp.]